MTTIDARGLDFAALNRHVRDAVSRGDRRILLKNVNGQRYIACGLKGEVRIVVEGVAGADTAAFMDGPEVVIRANAEAAIGNTMNSGKVVVHGSVGDVSGYAMRGGRLFILHDAGYRLGIHMKSFCDRLPIVVVGGRAQDFLGEYMAGGVIIVLGWTGAAERPLVGRHVGVGMHGGVMYLRGRVDQDRLSREVSAQGLGPQDHALLARVLREYAADFRLPLREMLAGPFLKLASQSHRPYGQLYAY
jgi:glutamate synthase domain-containing protein 3